MKTHTKITSSERDLIAHHRAKGLSIRAIASKLDRSPSTISREIRRNRWQDYYVAIHAQAVSDERKLLARKRHPLRNERMFVYIMDKLKDSWSPEQIAGRLKNEHPNDKSWHIHHETIYRYIYSKENKIKKLWEYLPRKQKRRKKQNGRSSQRVRIPDRVSIHQRPKEIEKKHVFGHWEGDSVESKSHKGGVHTQVERKTRYYLVCKIKDLSAEQTTKAQSKMYRDLPNLAKKSTTVDNGREFTDHKSFSLPVFFADPYSSWQRGSNEYHNGLLRRYLPKGTDFNPIDQTEIDDIVEEINNKPRKCLHYQTPKEAFTKELECCDSI